MDHKKIHHILKTKEIDTILQEAIKENSIKKVIMNASIAARSCDLEQVEATKIIEEVGI